MSFDFSTLVTDRTQADVNRVKEIADKIKNGTSSESELAEFNSAAMKGAYNYTDLNRVTAAMEDLKLRLEGYGYSVPGYQKIEVPHPVTGGGSRLPDGYTRLTHIESTGTQYIDTGFKPNSNTRIVADMEITSGTTSFLFGARHNNSANATSYSFSMVQISGASLRSDFGSVETTVSVSPVQRLEIDKNGNTTTVNGTTVTATAQSFSGSYNLALFTVNTAGTINSTKTSAKLYSCQIYDNGTLVRDYVPCISSDGVVGLYDLVTATFFGNSGTGSFVAGVIPRELPDGYTQVEYIEASGTQYIDTGVKPNGNSRVVLYGNNLSSSSKWVFGSWHNWYTNEFGFNFETGSSAANGFRYGGVSAGVTGVPVGAFYLDHNGTSYTFNSTKGTMTAQQFTSSYSMYLFRFNAAGNASSGYFVGRIYYCKIYDNGTLVRDFVPCINSTGIAGLYDMVTAEFYQNAGTGTFTVGNPVTFATQSSSGRNLNSGTVTLRNLVADGSFETTNTWSTWSTDALVTEQALFGTKSLKLTGDQMANVSVETPIVGHKYYGREYIKTDGEVTIGDGRFEVHGGDGVGLNWVYGWNRGNYPNWTMQSAIHEIEVVNASSYVLRTFKVGGTCTCYVDGILLVDLTEAFGAGFEPDKEWCDTYIPFFEGTQFVELPPRYEWKEYDVPTTGQMVAYLQNVAVIRSVLAVMASTPNTPDNMVGLMVKEANDIEVILMDVYRQINIMATTFVPCGEALCGGDNL